MKKMHFNAVSDNLFGTKVPFFTTGVYVFLKLKFTYSIVLSVIFLTYEV